MTDFDRIRGLLEDIESREGENEATIDELKEKIDTLEAEINNLQGTIEDLEREVFQANHPD